MKLNFKREETKESIGFIFKTYFDLYRSTYTVELEPTELEGFKKILKSDYDILNNKKHQDMNGVLRAKYLISVFYAYRGPKTGYSTSGGSISNGEFSDAHSGKFLWDICKEGTRFSATSMFRSGEQRAVWEQDIGDRLTALKEELIHVGSYDNEPKEESIDI